MTPRSNPAWRHSRNRPANRKDTNRLFRRHGQRMTSVCNLPKSGKAQLMRSIRYWEGGVSCWRNGVYHTISIDHLHISRQEREGYRSNDLMNISYFYLELVDSHFSSIPFVGPKRRQYSLWEYCKLIIIGFFFFFWNIIPLLLIRTGKFQPNTL